LDPSLTFFSVLLSKTKKIKEPRTLGNIGHIFKTESAAGDQFEKEEELVQSTTRERIFVVQQRKGR